MHLWKRNTTVLPEPYIVPSTGKFDGNDGNWGSFKINVGTPGQNFRVLISTASTATWVPLSAGCGPDDPDDCPDQRGVELFGGARSRGYQSDQSSTAQSVGLFGLKLGTEDFSSVYGSGYGNLSASFFQDIVGLGDASEDSLMLTGEVVGGIISQKLLLGSFGLGTTPNNFGGGGLPTFLSLLPNSTVLPIPSLSYGYTSGAKYRSGNYFGSLTLGGFDSARFTYPTHSYAFTSELDVTVQSILVNTNTRSDSVTLDTSDFGGSFKSRIDTTLPYFWLPQSVCDRLEEVFGLKYDTSTDLYFINDTMRQTNIDNKASVVIKFADSATSPNFTSITLPYSAFDLNVSWPIVPNPTSYFPIRRSQNNVNILGRTLLQEAYLTVDFERNNFSIGQATFGAQAPSPKIIPITRKTFATEPEKPGMSTGTKIGIGVGIGVAFIAILVIGFFLLRRHRTREKLRKQKEANDKSRHGGDEVTSPMSGLSSIFSDGNRTVASSELAATVPRHRRVSELSSPESEPTEYFVHRKVGSQDTSVSELESPPEVHELPGDGELMPRSLALGAVKEETDEGDRDVARQ